MATLPQLLEEDIQQIDDALHELLRQSDGTTALVIDQGGFLITHNGDARQFDLTTIAALASCLIFTIPRSWDQAYGVLRIKMLYLWSDLFPRTMSVQASDESGESEEVNSELSGQEPSAINRHIGSKIREARIRAGMTLEKLSAAIGVSPAQVQKYESGKNRVSAEALFNFAKFFGLEVKFFYEGLEAPSRMRLVGDSNGDSRR